MASCYPDSRFCSALACPDVATITVWSGQVAPLGSTVELCLEDRCAMAMLTEGPQAPGWGTSAELVGDLAGRASLWWRDDGFEVQVGFELRHDLALVDGDSYTATLRGFDGSVLATPTWSATYEYDHPNGEGCRPECVYATLTPQ